MDSRMIFGNDVYAYDALRPRYGERVFEEIYNYSNITNESKIVEIGCGTGQATEIFLRNGYSIHAVEISESMSNFVRKKYCGELFSVENKAFEEASFNNESVDLFIAATSFHWVNKMQGYTKMWKSLKKGGCIALFWNRPFVARKNDPMHIKIQEIYKKYEYAGLRKIGKKQVEFDVLRYENIVNSIQEYNFDDIEFHTFKSVRKIKADAYVELLNTYSDHKMMEVDAKIAFENDIRNVINTFGGVLVIHDTVELYLARKLDS